MNDDVIVDVIEEVEATELLIVSIQDLMLNGADRDSYLATLIEEHIRLDKLKKLLAKLESSS